jgi:hypothetical protein
MDHVAIRTASESKVEIPMKPAEVGKSIVLAVVIYAANGSDSNFGRFALGFRKRWSLSNRANKENRSNPLPISE